MAKNKKIEDSVNRFITGDCETVMKQLPAESVDFVLTYHRSSRRSGDLFFV